jgi:hybrid polyketide synthase/nonribosomal peptide synthetase FtdB
LKVTKLVALIHERLGVALPLAAVFKAATIRDQAAVVLEAARYGVAGIDEPVVKLNAAAGPPIFAFPPGTGDALGYLQLAEHLQPYAMHGFNFLTAETRVPDYADIVQRLDPRGPHVLFGYSAGGNLAYHVAGELERRGARVAAIVMVDSGRVMQPLTFPPGQVERVTAEFLGHESIRAYVASPVLHEKATRMIAAYFDYLTRAVDHHVIAADIHGLVAADEGEHYDEQGRLQVSRREWAGVTRGGCRWTEGAGGHNYMLAPPHLEPNAALLHAIFDGIFSTRTAQPPLLAG